MADISEFISVIKRAYDNHSIYLWGGNGEPVRDLTIGKIRMKETNDLNCARVLQTIANRYRKGYIMTAAVAVDCSGLVIYALRRIKAIKETEDYRARDLQAMSTPVTLKELKAGDLVFNKKAAASHVGIFIGNNEVIEAQGRDYGVTKRRLIAGNWVIGGRLPYFK